MNIEIKEDPAKKDKKKKKKNKKEAEGDGVETEIQKENVIEQQKDPVSTEDAINDKVEPVDDEVAGATADDKKKKKKVCIIMNTFDANMHFDFKRRSD